MSNARAIAEAIIARPRLTITDTQDAREVLSYEDDLTEDQREDVLDELAELLQLETF